jgi:fructosamine-3-kinase
MMCPKTLRVGDLPDGGSYMIQEFVEFDADALHEPATQQRLGVLVARMHAHQSERHQQFGFGLSTCLGTLPMDNSFKNSWSDFFIEQRLRPHLTLIVQRFPDQAEELILLAPLIFDKARQVALAFHARVRPHLPHLLLARRTGAAG